MYGLYDDQIKQRIKSDEEGFGRSFVELSSAVMGNLAINDLDNAVATKNAIEALLKYYKVPRFDIPDSITDFTGSLEYALRRSNLAKRKVHLEKGWYKDAFGAYMVTQKDGTVITILPGKTGYYYFDYKAGKNILINPKTAEELGEEAYCFYKSLPAKPLTIKDFLLYIMSVFQKKDTALLGLMTFLTAAIGMLTPYINAQLFGNVLNLGEMSVLAAAAVFLVSGAVSGSLIRIMQTMVTKSIAAKAKLSVGAAMFMRILSLPPTFFKDKSSGEIASRSGQAESLCDLITGGLTVTLFSALFSLMYVGQIFAYAPALVTPALIIITATVIFSVLSVLATMRYNQTLMENQTQERGLTHALFSGVQKIKLAGAEKRAFTKWAKLYSVRAKMQYMPPFLIVFTPLITLLITSAGTLTFYFTAANAGISTSEYMAFNAAFGLVSGAFVSLAGTARTFTQIHTTLKNMKSILDATPEASDGKQIAGELSGAVELTNVSFKYADNMPWVLDNLSLKIDAGSYIAIVGATGCGKSTLMRILLGFETPKKGAVYYDGRDLSRLDLKSFRKNGVGVVLQDGSLFQGDIFSNIIISAPLLTQKEAWEAAELAGIAEDIKAMPMGMHTIISEGMGGVSGGQKQRLMIARAVASKPSLLMLDEATSALDNITQNHVSESLAKLDCTRIIIAHRLSTIKKCDRIIFLDKGKIVEDGTYEELMEKDGAFADLVRRQQV